MSIVCNPPQLYKQFEPRSRPHLNHSLYWNILQNFEKEYKKVSYNRQRYIKYLSHLECHQLVLDCMEKTTEIKVKNYFNYYMFRKIAMYIISYRAIHEAFIRYEELYNRDLYAFLEDITKFKVLFQKEIVKILDKKITNSQHDLDFIDTIKKWNFRYFHDFKYDLLGNTLSWKARPWVFRDWIIGAANIKLNLNLIKRQHSMISTLRWRPINMRLPINPHIRSHHTCYGQYLAILHEIKFRNNPIEWLSTLETYWSTINYDDQWGRSVQNHIPIHRSVIDGTPVLPPLAASLAGKIRSDGALVTEKAQNYHLSSERGIYSGYKYKAYPTSQYKINPNYNVKYIERD